MSGDKRPRHYAWEAYQIYLDKGKDAAIEHIRSIKPEAWRRLIYTHVKNMAHKAGAKGGR